MPELRLDKKFADKLRENGALDKYKKNVVAYITKKQRTYPGIDWVARLQGKLLTKSEPLNYKLSASFVYLDTPEGDIYWYKMEKLITK